MFKLHAFVSVLFPVVSVLALAQSAPNTAERSTIANAGLLYYNLQREGVRELRCNAHPDWQRVLASNLATSPDAKARALPYLARTRFSVVMTAAGTKVAIERADAKPLAPNLRELVDLVRFNIQGPLDFWRLTSFKILIPGPSENYQLKHRGGRYTIIPTDVNVQINLDENWIIQEITIPVPGEPVTLSVLPHYAKNPKGLLLSSLDARNVADPSQQNKIMFDYFEQEGMQLPGGFDSRSQHPDGVVSIPVTLDHYTIERTRPNSARP